MSKPKILVTGATGKTGGALVSQLREQDWPVRAIVRKRDARSKSLEAIGAETVVADMFDPDQIFNAMKGIARVYYLPPFDPYMIQSVALFALAAREARLESIVGLTQWTSSSSHPSLATRQNWLMNHLFDVIPGVAHTIVNPGYFADNYLNLIGFAAHLGVFPSLTGDSRNAPPSNEDIARVAVAALVDPDKHAGKSYRPTGPALLSTADMTDILSRVLRRKVRRVEMPLWLFLKAARLQGQDPFVMSGFRFYVEDHKRGAFSFGAPTDDVLEVTGRSPEDFETIASRYAATTAARRSFGADAKAIIDFLRTPLSPGYDLDRFDREMRFPVPPTARFVMEDERWKAEHHAQVTSVSQTSKPAVATPRHVGEAS